MRIGELGQMAIRDCGLSSRTARKKKKKTDFEKFRLFVAQVWLGIFSMLWKDYVPLISDIE